MKIRALENELLKIETMEDWKKVRKLPIAVLVQKPNSRIIYRIDDVEAYFNEVFTMVIEGKRRLYPFPSVKVVEAGCKKYGKIVQEDSFKRVRIFPAQCGYHSSNYFWEMYRADFENIMQRTEE